MNTQIKDLNLTIKIQDIEHVVDMLDTAIDASIELINLYSSNKYEVFNQLLGDLQSMMDSLSNIAAIVASERKHSLIKELLDNVNDTLLDINSSVEIKNDKRVLEKIEFQLLPFIRNLRESFYFWGLVYPDKEKMKSYYKNEFAENYRNYYVNEEGNFQYKISIVVPAYNHLDVTKRCINQLLKVTDFEKLNAELILVDHGSSDETLEYFESLNIGKVIHFKNNVRMYMFTTMHQICKGQYFAYVSNDVLVTKNWVENLITCLDSDENIIVAVPTTPNVCNLQMIKVPTNNPEEFINWAEKNNLSDSKRWNDRARIIPPLCSYNTTLVNNIGFADPLFYSMEFWDDDFSLRARRKGYRQIVCDDVACYHYGSVTGKEFQKKEKTLEFGRELFKQKHGVDAWGKGFCYDIQCVSIIKKKIELLDNNINLLGIDCGFGDTVLQMENELKNSNRKYDIYSINSQEQYSDDISHFSDKYINTSSLIKEINNFDKITDFDLVWIERDIEEYEDINILFKSINNRIKDNGFLVCHCQNPYNIITLNNMLNLNIKGERKILLDYNDIIQVANNYFKKIEVIKIPINVAGIEEFVDMHYRNVKNKQELIDKLSVDKYYFVFEK